MRLSRLFGVGSRLNTPKYFLHEEEKDLLHFLDYERENYYMVKLDSKTIGCGGTSLRGTKSDGYFSWGMIHPEYHGKGIGSILLKHRIKVLKQNKNINRILVRTTQYVYQFYEKSGFKLVETVKDYWGKGFDLYTMEYQDI